MRRRDPRPRHRARPVPARSSGRFALASSFGAWILYLALVGLRVGSFGFPRPWLLMERHLLSAGAGLVLNGFAYLVLRNRLEAGFGLRLLAALVCAVPPAILLSVANYDVMYVFAPSELFSGTDIDPHPPLFRTVLQTIAENYFVFVAWTVLYTAYTQAVQTQAALRRAAASEVAARDAEVRALRYQLDPHFLFNALNTISGLILDRDLAGAERTVGALSGFLRITLAIDATADIPLADEVRLQQLYLEIEKVRYGDRLHVEIDISGHAAGVRVPALLLQPVVENSIRHAVARSALPVRLRLSAWCAGAMLHVVVENDGPLNADAGGHGIGLRNIKERLMLRYGVQGTMRYGPRAGGGFSTRFSLPLQHRPSMLASSRP